MASASVRKKRPKKTSPKRRAKPLTNAELLKLVAKHRPPQSWYGEEIDPTVPATD